MTKEGAVNNQLMLATCRNDQEDELGKLLEEGTCDPNFVDGAGNTAAHYAAKAGSIGCLELLVNEDDIDLDVKNRLEGDTPLHKAVQFQNDHAETAYIMVELLIAGGADPRIVNRNKLTPSALVNPNNKELKKLLEDAVASYQFDESDFVGNHDDDSDDDQPSD
ncbi:ankyrin [Fennellomyces sp. T-0311]|nr:ankyrin [Fennellomyces sp. T-0311]